MMAVLVYAAPALKDHLPLLFTAIIHHSHMPPSLCNCILLPIPKGQKDPSKSDNYRSIALAPSLSKDFEWAILIQYSEVFFTSDLQFGFKKGFSTTLCTGLHKNTISRYVHRGSNVFGCFLMLQKHLILLHMIFFSSVLLTESSQFL